MIALYAFTAEDRIAASLINKNAAMEDLGFFVFEEKLFWFFLFIGVSMMILRILFKYLSGQNGIY
jgi:hypothetical protein